MPLRPSALNVRYHPGMRRRYRGCFLRRHRDGTLRLPRRHRLQGKWGRKKSRRWQNLPKGGNLLEIIFGLAGDGLTMRSHTWHRRRRRRPIPISRSSALSPVTGIRPPRRKRWRRCCRHCHRSWGVVDQGGDGYGAAQAFAAAHKQRPTIIMGNRQDELSWWQEQKAKDGYATWSALHRRGKSLTTGLSGWRSRSWTGTRKSPTRRESCPTLPLPRTISEAALARSSPRGGVASKEYSQTDALAAIKANMK